MAIDMKDTTEICDKIIKACDTDYLNQLELNYQLTNSYQDEDDQSERIEYLSDNIFEFTTYENIISSLFTVKALEVCEAITKGTTYEYINTDEGNFWYLTMVNMPFFQGKIEWGTSIRGAWWTTCKSDIIFNIYKDGKYEGPSSQLKFKDDTHWNAFVLAMIEFAKKDTKEGPYFNLPEKPIVGVPLTIEGDKS